MAPGRATLAALAEPYSAELSGLPPWPHTWSASLAALSGASDGHVVTADRAPQQVRVTLMGPPLHQRVGNLPSPNVRTPRCA
jgi:hypothetical protein